MSWPDAYARSALFAVYRRLSLSPSTLRLERTPETEAIFKGLLPSSSKQLVALPLLSRKGRLSGALVTAVAAGEEGAQQSASLDTIAALVGPAMEVAWQQTLARRDQERLQLFSETTEESLWDWNIAANEVWWGGNLEQLFGGRARVSRRPDWRQSRIHHEDLTRVVSSFDRALASDTSSWSAEYRIQAVDDSSIHVREHVYFLREADGRAYRAIGTVRDITSLQRMLERETRARASAERANAVKDEFLAMLGHELRNPLAPMVAVLSLMERRATGPDVQLDILRRQTRHLVRMVDDLLDVSRITSGKIELNRQLVLAESLIQRAFEMVQPLIEQRRHSVEFEVMPSLEIEVDSTRMTQVLSNLLANAAKYTEPGGRIRVMAAVEGGQAVVRVRDNGLGVAPEFLSTMFEMFAQGPQALDRAQGGLGLGLSIVRNIVTLHEGSVEAQSEGLGCGTEVVVKLPLPASAEVMRGEFMPSVPMDVSPRKLLVVDDNEDAATSLEVLLSMNGHAVAVAHHPHDALRLFAESRPDVALIDIGLPVMDGYELVRRMRALPGSEATRFVALTGYGQASDKVKASDAGFDAHMVKPIAPEHLERLIDQLTLQRDV